MEYPKFKVTVSCMTYNQSKYITDAMNGFTMQQTSFPFVCTIVDDASTDGEQEVIRKYVEENFDFSEGSVAFHKETDYAHITYAQHKTNKNCYFAVLYLKENHYSKRKDNSLYLKEWRDGVEYMALCEGDDYWIVPDKLEKQVSFMDENEEYSMCFTNANVIYDVCGSKDKYKDLYAHLQNQDYSGKEILERWTIPTASVIHRLTFKVPNDERFIHGDIVLFLSAAHKGKVHCINEKTVCYRRNANGLSMQKIDLNKILAHYDAILEKFGTDYCRTIKILKAKCLSSMFVSCRLNQHSWHITYLALKEGVMILYLFYIVYSVIIYTNNKLTKY